MPGRSKSRTTRNQTLATSASLALRPSPRRPGHTPEPGSFPQAAPEAVPFPEAGAFPEPAAFEDEPDAFEEPEPVPSQQSDASQQPSAPEQPNASERPNASEPPNASEQPAAPEQPDAFPEAGPAADAGHELEPRPGPDPVPAASGGLGSQGHPVPDAQPAQPAPSGRSMAARLASLFVDLDADRRTPSVGRVLNGPSRPDDPSWRRRVKVATGGQGPGPRDRAAMDRDRVRMPLPGPRRIAVLGCTSGAGQSVIAMMTGHTLAALRDVPVAALDLNPGDTSLAARIEPAISVTALLAGQGPDPRAAVGAGRARSGRGGARGRVDVIAGPPGTSGARPLGAGDYERLGRLLDERYPLTMIDPAPAGLTRVLSLADQLVLVTPASPEAASALANTQQWLGAHGFDELAARAVTVVNGVSSRSMDDVLRTESVARGRCRAIVRVPWDGSLIAAPDVPAALHPQTRLACTALAGVLISGLAVRAPELGTPPAAAPSPTHVREKESW